VIELSRDAQFLNSIVNHPAVYPWVCGPLTTPLDATALVADESNILLRTTHGAFLFLREGPGKYEVHTQFLPEGRGTALAAAREAADFMFTRTDCCILTTMVDESNRIARLLTLRSGFEFVKTAGIWRSHGTDWPLHHYWLTLKAWVHQRTNQCHSPSD
jgi:hypothetical protein